MLRPISKLKEHKGSSQPMERWCGGAGRRCSEGEMNERCHRQSSRVLKLLKPEQGVSVAEIFGGRQEKVLVHAKKFGMNYIDNRELLKATLLRRNRAWLPDDCKEGT